MNAIVPLGAGNSGPGGPQAWFWTPEWQAGEAEADADIAAGRVTVFGSAEEMDAALNDGPEGGYGEPVSTEWPSYGPDRGVRRYDDLPPLEAIVAAWVTEGPSRFWHRRAKMAVHRAMPELARALDRAAAERGPVT